MTRTPEQEQLVQQMTDNYLRQAFRLDVGQSKRTGRVEVR
jgi:hypothetical protein